MGANPFHWHVVQAAPSDKRDCPVHTCTTFEAACYLAAEGLEAAAEDIARLDGVHKCGLWACPTYGASCPRRVSASYLSMAEDFRATPGRWEGGPEPGGLTMDWCRHRVVPCNAPACAPTQ